MKLKSVLAACGLVAALAIQSASAEEALRVGIAPEPFLPYSTLTASNQWEGFEPDLVRAVCARMKTECSLTAIAWDGLIPSLTEGKVDIIVGAFSINEERQKIVDFSTPYDHEASNILGMKSDTTEIGLVPDPEDSNRQIIDAETLAGKLVGAQSSSTQAMYLQKYLTSADAKNYDTADNALADLLAGRIDYVILPDTYAEPFLTSDQGADYEVKRTIPDNPIMGQGIGMAVQKGNGELLGNINEALKALESDGEIAALAKKWFPNRK